MTITVRSQFQATGRYGEEVYDFDTTSTTTIKDIKTNLNDKFIFGDDLDSNQYEIKAFKLIPNAPADIILLSDEDIVEDILNRGYQRQFILNVKLKIKLDIPYCRFNTLYLYTYDDNDVIYEKVKQIIYDKRHHNLQTMTAYYGSKNIDNSISIFGIYNNSTLDIYYTSDEF